MTKERAREVLEEIFEDICEGCSLDCSAEPGFCDDCCETREAFDLASKSLRGVV